MTDREIEKVRYALERTEHQRSLIYKSIVRLTIVRHSTHDQECNLDIIDQVISNLVLTDYEIGLVRNSLKDFVNDWLEPDDLSKLWPPP